MPRLSVPLTDEQHKAIKVKAAETGLPQAEVARRLLLAWLVDEIDLPEEQELIEVVWPQATRIGRNEFKWGTEGR